MLAPLLLKRFIRSIKLFFNIRFSLQLTWRAKAALQRRAKVSNLRFTRGFAGSLRTRDFIASNFPSGD